VGRGGVTSWTVVGANSVLRVITDTSLYIKLQAMRTPLSLSWEEGCSLSETSAVIT